MKREYEDSVKTLFDGWEETMIRSCLERVMGTVYVDGGTVPVSAAAAAGDFCFLAGEPDGALLAASVGEGREFVILVPRHEGWSRLIEAVCGDRARRITRYAMKKEPEVFDRGHLERLAAALPEGCELRMMDEPLFHLCREQEWSRDFVANYRDYGMYQALGLGVAALMDGELVSGASSYTSYRGGIEIEVDTREDVRRRGLACACAARLILECMERGLYPSWDAHNLASVALAEKLGYHLDYPYPAYELSGGLL